MRRTLVLLASAWFAASVLAQSPLEALRDLAISSASKLPVKELKLRVEPAPKVRPLETVLVQALIYGEDDEGEKVRIQSEGVVFRVEKGGRISKPFRYQGKEEEAFYEPATTGVFTSILRQGTAQYALQDSALYAAPGEEGDYIVVASVGGVEAKVEIEVTKDADSQAGEEKTAFPEERQDGDRYRWLAERYAPFIAQETWFEPKYDYLARFDMDGDFRGDNNWENAVKGSSQAYVYYTAMETETHWFLIYNFFHPRDYSDKCVIGTCHENDNEGLILTIQKDGSEHGRLRAMETLAHNNVYSHTLGDDVRPRAHDLDGRIDLDGESHPVVFIEAGGHGVLGASTEHSLYDADKCEFKSGSGVTYVYKGKAERPQHPNDREVGYELLPMWEHWWVRAQAESARTDGMFDAYYSYRPVGARPVPRSAEIAGAFLGRAQSENKAKPFWGWHDNKTRKAGLLATGQWALDPAYSAQVDLRFPERFSLEYAYNPYLGIGSPAERAAVEPPIRARKGGGASGTFEYEAEIEGEAILSIRSEQVEVVTGSPHEAKTTFSGPIAQAGLRKLEVKSQKGLAEVLAAPSEANGYATIVRARADGKKGRVRFRMEWAE